MSQARDNRNTPASATLALIIPVLLPSCLVVLLPSPFLSQSDMSQCIEFLTSSSRIERVHELEDHSSGFVSFQ